VKKFLLSAVALFIAASCAPPAVKTTVLAPAKYHDAAKLREVAVLPFDGLGGAGFASEIEGLIAGVNIGDKQYFTLVDRMKLDRVMSEMKFSQSALVDPNNAANLGKMVGAKGIYTGVVTASNASDNWYSEDRSRCAQHEIKYDKKGNPYEGKCLRYESYKVNCTKRIAVFSFVPKLIEVETGRVVYANTISQTAQASACQDSAKPLSSAEELIAQAKQRAKEMLRRDIAPHYVTLEIKLMDAKDGVTSGQAEKKLEQGIDFAKANRLDRACELWGEARISSPNAPSVLYNLGICAEVTGDLQQALDLYRKADRLLNKPDDNITVSIARVSEAMQKQKKLKEQIGK
jgi:tetratricopeptide (TPR) repeat protein